MTFDVDSWAKIAPGAARLEHFLTPEAARLKPAPPPNSATLLDAISPAP